MRFAVDAVTVYTVLVVCALMGCGTAESAGLDAVGGDDGGSDTGPDAGGSGGAGGIDGSAGAAGTAGGGTTGSAGAAGDGGASGGTGGTGGTDGSAGTGMGGLLLLKSGFEPTVAVSADLRGLIGSDVAGYAWTDKPAWIADTKFQYVVKSDPLADYQEPVIESTLGPGGTQSHVLRMINKKDDPQTSSPSRTEFSFYGREAPNDYQEGYTRYWAKLQDNLPALFAGSGHPNPFYVFIEWKEPNTGVTWTKDECQAAFGPDAQQGGTNNYRVNVGLRKDAVDPSKLRWVLKGQIHQPCSLTEWTHINDDVHVPVGRWFLVEAFMRKHATNGRVYFAVDGQVVLDTDVTVPAGFHGQTTHVENPLRMHFWSAMKIYFDPALRYNGPISAWYDDFELWTSFPPGHPAW